MDIQNNLNLGNGVANRVFRSIEKYKHKEITRKNKTMIKALKIILAQTKETNNKAPITLIEPDTVYAAFEATFNDLKVAIEKVIEYEVKRQTQDIIKQYEELKDEAKKSNWISNLRQKFQGN